MPRLFVAVDVPAEIKAELTQLLPVAKRGIRYTPSDQLHLTLHFLGETELASTVAALQTIVAPAFCLTLEGVGRFGSAQRGVILWAGIHESQELQQLHAAISAALIPTGYQPESRPFSPHLTLARCKPDVPQELIDDFLQRNARFKLPEFPVTEFSLYSSVLTPEGPVHYCERIYPLVSAHLPQGGLCPPTQR